MDTNREDRLRFAKHFERAQGWLLLDKHAEAASALDEIPVIFHSFPAVLLVRSQIHMETRQWKLAEPFLRQLLEKDATEPQHWISLAYVVRRAKSIKEAAPILQEARKRFPTVALIWFNLACYAAQETRLQEARDLLTEALRLEPSYRELAKTDSDLEPLRNSDPKPRI